MFEDGFRLVDDLKEHGRDLEEHRFRDLDDRERAAMAYDSYGRAARVATLVHALLNVRDDYSNIAFNSREDH